jgi:hypothetical protein
MPGLELRQVNYRGPLRGTDKAVVVLEGQQMTVPMEWLVKPWGGGKRIWPSWGKPRGGAARGRRAPVTPRLFHAGHEGYWWRRDTGTPFEKTRPERWIFYSPEGFQKAWVFQMEEPSDTNTPWMWLDGVSRSRGDDGTDPIAGWGSAEEAKADYVAWFRPYMGEKKGQSARKHSSRVSKCISGKVRGEGWEQRRAVAACLSMERGGSLRPDGSYIPKGSRSLEPVGDCFEANGRYFMEHALFPGDDKKLRLVHGEVCGEGRLEGVQYAHSWVEDGSTIIDMSNNRSLQVPKAIYYKQGCINQIKNLKRYTPEQFRKKILKHEHWGPWDLVTSSGL